MTLVGATEPRLYTPPLRPLDKDSSRGFEVIAFAVIVLQVELDPWQAWFLIHALELLPDGRYRFRKILLVVARQNGKTTILKVLVLWAMLTGSVRLVVGTAQDLDTARQTWDEVRYLLTDEEADPEIYAEAFGGSSHRGYVITANGKEEIRLHNGARYKIKATNADAGRGIPGVGLVLFDELRTHKDWDAWASVSNTTMAVPNALIIGLSNAGTDESVVLNELRAQALAEKDPTLAIFEWSAPEGCALGDRDAWRQANPSLGRGRMDERALEAALSAPAAIFRTENLCQRVVTTDHALDQEAWRGGLDKASVADYREAPMYGAVDVSLDGQHTTLVIGTPVADGKVRVWTAAAWDSVDAARVALPAILAALKLKRLAWCTSGPAAELSPVLRTAGRRPGSKRGTELVELTGVPLSEACMGLAGAVRGRLVLHQGDALLDSQVDGAGKLWQGDRFVFTRRGAGHVDAVYSLALCVHAILTAPRPRRAWTSEETSGPAEAEAPGRDPRAPRPLDRGGA